MFMRMNNDSTWRMPAEWEPQRGVQLTWPHQETDWAPMLDEVTETYVQIALEISQRERLLIVAPEPQLAIDAIRPRASLQQMNNITTLACPTDDTWARDHGFITLTDDQGHLRLLDFCFNGWGRKFAADKDNAINRRLYEASMTNPTLQEMVCGDYVDHLDFVLEGGSIESDGQGTIYTTTCCLLAPNRNQPLSQDEITEQLKQRLHARQIVWLDDAQLPGDDTDGHIDTVARAVPGGLLRLPLPEPIYDEDGEQLPATYANSLVINGAVLCPTYGQPEADAEALRRIGEAFPDREIVGIDCRNIIRQHGSLHCCTMQFFCGGSL